MDLSELDAPSQIGLLFTTSKGERNAHDNFGSVVYQMKGVYAGIMRADGRVRFLRRDELDLMRSNFTK